MRLFFYYFPAYRLIFCAENTNKWNHDKSVPTTPPTPTHTLGRAAVPTVIRQVFQRMHEFRAQQLPPARARVNNQKQQ